jgi:hypothetical protein
MHIHSLIQRFVILLSLLLLTSACTILGGDKAGVTPTPVPTSSISGRQVIASEACQVAEQGMIRVSQSQGDLISWSPVTNTLAYIASTQGSSWNVGDLNTISAPLFANPIRLATQAAGQLTWSPDGITLAFLGLRRSDNLYTIGLAYPSGIASKDLFPGDAARTDDYSSQKAIIEWVDKGRLKVVTSCGLDCMQPMIFGAISGLSTPLGGPVQHEWDLWSVKTNQPAIIPDELANRPGQLNWSPDESHIAYIDEAGNAWVIEVGSGTLYPLDIGGYGTATETDWSYDGQYLAVQVDQNLKIFSFNCPK